MITPLGGALLGPAGVLAGMVGSAGGITSLVSYPALLLAGVPTFPANVANQVAIVACWPGSALSSRRELAGRAGWLRRWALLVAVGGALGAGLLLVTSSRTFAQVVPFLVLVGAVALLFEPLLSRLRARANWGESRVLLALALLPLSVYNGYFGAGSGVMLLTLMLVVVDRRLPQANALKNMLLGVATFTAAAVFVVRGSVAWEAIVPLAAGLFIGARIGPLIARRVPANVLRVLIALLGFGLAIDLWLTA